MQLKGKTAVVTGGSRGIGRAIALELASCGANVVVNYTRNSKAADEVVAEIEAMGSSGMAVKADVSIASEVENLVNEVLKTFGSIDILVNNAGITRDNLIIRMTEKEFDEVINTNLKGTFICTKAVSRVMIKQKSGKIINVSSVVGIVGNAGQSNYAAAKAGLIGFTKSMAKELAKRGINVNAVAPGFIQTDMTSVLPDNVKEEFLKSIPLMRIGKPEDIAKTVLFLVSEYSDYITGQVINIDGGMVM
ncbi:MAG TPA: 3-oxoacyl-[acyl-carrier-protein] reductase [Bacillota bacterium]|nr:3-oxoacyl-[acyl-carrier-protein] reductase [Clostridiaceae bacterium]HNR04282.1 3-oxoacyl-[acyl-carrier-protein] reductase [Bacillota bacterium]HNT03083.1 3-oxoacyl-[acyl-carrier-protein] reductase [Bacillota bacterium]HPA55360.1 3-oxoacyl-[acyl-carrier-protein] reductase [Bacillota bacterium]HPX68520.1 3-oxoacyl-[acyl-carrier-protein] reductase [Bacillota bacterium]